MQLARIDERSFRSPVQEGSDYGMVYGGQLMGQFIAAAAHDVDHQRVPIILQMCFLNAGRLGLPVDLEVTELQTGRRLATRHVRATQAGRIVADGHVTFQTPLSGPQHQRPFDSSMPPPEECEEPAAIKDPLRAQFLVNSYSDLVEHPFIECRVPASEAGLFPQVPQADFRVWCRIRQRLPDDPMVHACTLAYMSDLWTSWPGVIPRVHATNTQKFNLPSLNHSLWFHAACRGDEWLLCEIGSPRGSGARTFATGHMYSRDGVLVASLAQQSLVTSG